MKSIIISVALALILIGAASLSARSKNTGPAQTTTQNNVTIVDGKQIIEIKTKGGYQPAKSVAKAGIPTVLRFATSGTFDCSASVRIPSMNISKDLPNSGKTDIDVGSPHVATLAGTCGMGMYSFEIEFQG